MSSGSSETKTLLVAMVLLTLMLGTCTFFSAPLGDDESSSDDNAASILAGAAPWIRSAPFEPYPVTSGEPTDFSFFVRDNDSTSLNLTWDWGDGIVETNNITFTLATNVRINRTHIYNPVPEPGRDQYHINFSFNLTVTDPDLNFDFDITIVDCTVNVTNAPPPPAQLSIAINATIVDPAESVYIMASAVDPEGEALTWTFTFNDSVQVYRVYVSHTPASAPGQRVWNNITHVFGTIGRHKVEMRVSDALVPYQVFPHNVSTSMDVDVAINSVPGVSDTISTDPSTLIINATLGYGLLEYSIQVLDIDGDIVTAIWNFSDGTPEVVNISAGGTDTYTFVQIRNYTDGGVYNVTVNVTDGRPGHEVLIYKIVQIESTNLPPLHIDASPRYFGNLTYAAPNQTVNFTLVIQDPEMDTVYVMVDFGDGSAKLYANLTEFVDRNATLLFQHAYSKVGNYTVLINYTDNKIGKFQHDKNVTIDVKIYIPPEEEVVIWNAWDYISLGLLCMIPVLVAARLIIVGRRRKQLEQEGVTLEEWKLMTSEMGSQDKKT